MSDSPLPSRNMFYVKVKELHGTDYYRLEQDHPWELSDLRAAIAQALDIKGEFWLAYPDDDKDWIAIKTEEEWRSFVFEDKYAYRFAVRLGDFSMRATTVAKLYSRLNRLKFIHVRGTPASGKTILASLLFDHIKDTEGVGSHWLSAWPKNSGAPGAPALSGSALLKFLVQGWDWGDGSVLIVDEAQGTYWDHKLWNDIIKPLAKNPRVNNRIIFLSIYGSPTSPGKDAPIGLLFTEEEYKDHLSRRRMLHSHKFDMKFLEWMFKITAGHVGAFEDIFRVITALDSYRAAGGPASYTYAYFTQNVDPHDMVRALEEDTTIFSRGAPGAELLRNKEIAEVFNHVLCNGSIILEPPLSDNCLPPGAIGECFKHGWLHAVATTDDRVEYLFSTPIHKWFVEWKLYGVQLPTTLPYPDLFSFSCNVISHFSPSSFSTERIVTPSIIQRPPEAQFQREFYRCCFKLAQNHFLTFPEFGTALGRADFYIPSKKWGIEVLRDGNELAEPVGRFDPLGKYGMTLDLADHIVLDFRFQRPILPHPTLKKLYYVVFTPAQQSGMRAL